MKSYYVIKSDGQPDLVRAADLKSAKLGAQEKWPHCIIHSVSRATPGDLDFIEWLDETREERAKQRDTGEPGLARHSGSGEGGEAPLVLDRDDHGPDGGCNSKSSPSTEVRPEHRPLC